MNNWYTHLNRNQLYLRSYRTHNLWLDQYMKKMRTPRVHAFHIGLFKRVAKTYFTPENRLVLTLLPSAKSASSGAAQK